MVSQGLSAQREGGRWGVVGLINENKRKLTAALKLLNNSAPFSNQPLGSKAISEYEAFSTSIGF